MTAEHPQQDPEDFGDEGLARRYGPDKLALWFDEHKGHRNLNEPLWQTRRTLIQSDFWRGYDYSEIPLIPEWFGMLLPFERAYRETGIPTIWCIMLGFPREELRSHAIKLIQADRPAGLLKIDANPPDPNEYSLPLVGFLAKGAYLTLQSETPRHYDHWKGYETLGLTTDDDVGLMELVDTDSAERLLMRKLALSAGRWFDSLEHRSEFDSLVSHARELWALQSFAAAGAVAGTAMESLLRASLPPTRIASKSRQNLARLIDAVTKEFSLPSGQKDRMHEFRAIRNQCAHALEDNGQEDADPLQERIDTWLDWLETQTVGSIPGPVRPPRRLPEPNALHHEAHSAGQDAGRAVTPIPMTLQRSDGEEIVVTEGLVGWAIVTIRPQDDPLAKWLVTEGRAQRHRDCVRMSCYWPSHSLARAAAYARAYAEVLTHFGISVYYETYLD